MDSYRHVLVFGDVHGENGKLQKLIAQAREIVDLDGIFTCGDLVDRGPDSFGVIETCISEGVDGAVGNHDLWLCQFAAQGVLNPGVTHPVMGSKATLKSYGVNTENSLQGMATSLKGKFPTEHGEFLQSLALVFSFKIGEQVYHIIHAGLKSNSALEDFSSKGIPEPLLLRIMAENFGDDMVWNNPSDLVKQGGQPLYHFKDGSVQIVGHTPVKNPQTGHSEDGSLSWLALDTGCGRKRDGKLSGVILSVDPSINMTFLEA